MFQNFQQAIDYLLSFDNWEASPSIEWDPTNNHARMISLLKLLGAPQKSFKKIIVGGTNGKGSTTALISDILSAHGLQTVMFNSPHLFSIKERISINGREVSDELWIKAVNQISEIEESFPKDETGPFTTFEALTATAALIGQFSSVDYGIFEVGLGGKYDSTNSWDSDLAVLTNIDLDHTHILGDTAAEIAKDKITISRKDKPLIISANQSKEVLNVVNSLHPSMGFNLICVDPSSYDQGSPAKPAWHYENLALAIEASKAALKDDFSLQTALEAADKCHVKGRFEILKEEPFLVRDCAHNPSAISSLIASLKSLSNNWVFICGFTKGHLHEESLKLVTSFAKHVFVKEPNSPKKVTLDEIKLIAHTDSNISFLPEGSNAQEEAFKAFPDSNICICGSFYLI